MGPGENLTGFRKAKCKVLCLGLGNLHCQYNLRNERMEQSPAEADLGVQVDGNLDMSQQVSSLPRKPNIS